MSILDDLETRMRRTGRANEPLLPLIGLLRDLSERVAELEAKEAVQAKAQEQLNAILQVDIPNRSMV